MNIFDDKFDFLHFVLKSGSCVKGVFKNKKEVPVLLKPIKDGRIYYNFEDRDEMAFLGKRETMVFGIEENEVRFIYEKNRMKKDGSLEVHFN